jgi:hypothetical protein
MRIIAETKQNATEIKLSSFTKEVIDAQIERELFIRVGLEIQKIIPVLQSYEPKPFNEYRYQTQMIVLSMDTFKNLMYFLEEKLPYNDFVRWRDILNKTI